MLGERLFQIWTKLGRTQRDMAELLGFKESTLSKWRSRTERDPDTKSIDAVSRTLFRDRNWLVGEEYAPEWSPRMRRAQGVLRDLAYETAPNTFTSQRERLLFIHSKLLAMLPDMNPTVWAWHLYWNPSDWSRLVDDPEFIPGEYQIKGASEITSIPARWFIDGDTARLRDMPSDELHELGRLLQSLNMDLFDAKRILTKRAPRH